MFIPPGENIVERKICTISAEEFCVTDADRRLLDACTPVIGMTPIDLPSPTVAPQARAQRRMAFRNERNLYKKTSFLTGKEIVTMYHPDDPRKVCEHTLWHGDGWSGYDFGRAFDFTRPFFPQFHELWSDVPMMALYHTGNCENCEYTNWFGGSFGAKDCYLCFNGGNTQGCMFCKGVIDSNFCFEMYLGSGDERCYECVNCNDCYATKFSQDCTNCRECIACESCVGCEHCFGCTNLANASYCIFNQKLSPDEYISRIEQLRITHDTRVFIDSKNRDYRKTEPRRAHRNVNCENCFGDYLYNCKNTIGNEGQHLEDVRYVNMSKRAKDSMDITGYGYFSDHMIESLGSGDSSRVLYTHTVEKCSDILYSAWCKGSNHLLGCCGLKQNEWSIFNRAYSQHEYETLALKIIDHMKSTGEWGEFFPASMSPFGYNETIGNDAFPLEKEEVERRGWNWYDIPKSSYSGEKVAPLDIRNYNEQSVGYEVAKQNIDTLLSGVIVCEESGQPFRIQREELAFYIDQDLPIPRRHPNIRYDDRLHFLSSKKLHQTVCPRCHEIIYSAHDPSRQRAILCESCFQHHVYGS